MDYSHLAFFPKRWEEKKADRKMFPWKGEQVVLLTPSKNYDPKVIGPFLNHLDAGWKLYADFTDRRPRAARMLDGLAPIAAIPDGGLTCGYGCGYVGATGIEMTDFHRGHYPKLLKNNDAVPHAYFYEMGRNYFTFGRRHDAFTTGFAVFMRYVCTDTLKTHDVDQGTRRVIDKSIQRYEERKDLGFLQAFTNAGGLSEKQNRLKVGPSDQPVMYASAMLSLWKSEGDNWLRGFYRQLITCPEANSGTREGALTQCLSWYVASSVAANRDLGEIFVTKWRLPLTEKQKEILSGIKWADPELKAGEVVAKLIKS
ncbi:MAG: hypothetical protein PVJ98_06890 [Akkermansiaceae bacterium]|jgi:hypothetical protein